MPLPIHPLISCLSPDHGSINQPASQQPAHDLARQGMEQSMNRPSVTGGERGWMRLVLKFHTLSIYLFICCLSVLLCIRREGKRRLVGGSVGLLAGRPVGCSIPISCTSQLRRWGVKAPTIIRPNHRSITTTIHPSFHLPNGPPF